MERFKLPLWNNGLPSQGGADLCWISLNDMSNHSTYKSIITLVCSDNTAVQKCFLFFCQKDGYGHWRA